MYLNIQNIASIFQFSTPCPCTPSKLIKRSSVISKVSKQFKTEKILIENKQTTTTKPLTNPSTYTLIFRLIKNILKWPNNIHLFQWNLVCDTKWIAAFITTIQMSGVLVGCFISGHLGDLLGRKPTFFLSLIILIVFNIVAYFSVNWQMYAAIRFILGMGKMFTKLKKKLNVFNALINKQILTI